MSFAAIILAAGASSRMGAPKALLPFRGETFLDRLIRLFAAHCSPVIVVLGHDADEIRRGIQRDATFVVNPDPDRGMLSSLQTGLAAVPADAEGFLFTPVDVPAIAEATVKRLAETKTERLLVIPRFQGRRGHPVRAAASLRARFLALPATGQAREVIHAHDGDILYVDVEDAGILTDVDDAAAYRALVQ